MNRADVRDEETLRRPILLASALVIISAFNWASRIAGVESPVAYRSSGVPECVG